MLTPTLISIIYPLLLNQLVSPGIDQGPVISGYLGVVLLTASLVALGVAISSLFANQIAAFAVTIGFFIFIWWVLGPISQVTGPSGAGSTVITYLDFQQHFFNNLIYGVIDLQDVAYFLSVTALGLFFGTVSVESRRWR